MSGIISYIILLCCPFLFCGSVDPAVLSSSDTPEEVLQKFISEVSGSAVKFSYGYSMKDGSALISGEGSVDMQGDAYLVTADGLEVYCDGKTMWTIDRQAEEVVIESCGSGQQSYFANPALFIRSFDERFAVSEAVAVEDGLKYRLIPVSEGTGISCLEAVISCDGEKLLSARMEMENGTVMDFTVPSFSFFPVSGSERFVFDTSSLGNSYVVTDLR